LRITNVNTLSAFLDRLITENIKLYFFEKEGKDELVQHQEKIIEALKHEIEELALTRTYSYLSERRTFAKELLVNLSELINNDLHIGEADRKRLEETKKKNPDVEVFIQQERRLRTANEGRSYNKNKIDELWGKIVEK